MQRIIISIVALVLISPAILFSQSQTNGSRFDTLRNEIRKRIATGEIPSMSVSVAQNGQIVWEEAFGFADIKRKTLATTKTRYAIASVSKPFVGTGVMILQERGKLSIDSAANKYMPLGVKLTNYYNDGKEITLRHLLQHRGGLPIHNRFFYDKETNIIPDIGTAINDFGFTAFPVGERYNYSNLGYGVLAYISSLAAGKSYDMFLKQEIFDPLGMRNTTLEIGEKLSRPSSKIYDSKLNEIPYYRFDEWGAGRIWSTPHDLVLFGMYHLKNKSLFKREILSESYVDKMVSENQTSGRVGGFYGTDWFYGLGWGGREKSAYGYKWYGHEGGMPGVSAQLKLFPEQNIVIAVTSNCRTNFTYDLVKLIEDILIPAHKEMKKHDPTETTKPQAVIYKTPDKLMGEWSGIIKTEKDSVAIKMIFEKDNDIKVKIGNDYETLLNNAKIEDDILTGTCFGNLTTENAKEKPTALWFYLKIGKGKFSGAVVIVNRRSEFPVMSNQPPNKYVLPYWTILKNEKP